MSDSTRETTLREHMLLASRFFRSPRTIGALAASSRTMGREMVADLPRDRPVTIVELGPGTGVLTRAIVDRIAPGSRFVAIDLESTFVEKLRRRWPAVDFVCGSAADLAALATDRQLGPVDHIISGLPFASIAVADTRRILDGVERTLRPEGTFTTFQYVHSYPVPSARMFRRDMSLRMGGPPTRRLVVRNFPSAFILTWTRTAVR
jgi:phosphatidylethanolamine/phosphatidyl-N-methylethanolamine N-methyltransferase